MTSLLPESRGASLQNLPFEVLGDIFTQCLPERCRPTVECAPLLLCYISSICRQVALGTPHLWKNLYISNEDFSPCRSSDRESLSSIALQWLSRAGPDLPLSLYFDYLDKAGVQDVLIPFAPRCRNLHLKGGIGPSWSHRNSLILFFGMPPGRVNELESLALSLDGRFKTPATAFEGAAKLRKVVLMCKGNPADIIRLPWHQLTHLTVTSHLPPPIWADLMKQCTKLQKGAFYVDRTRAGIPWPPLRSDDITTLNDLHDLDILLVKGRASYFRGFCFPSLTSLRLQSETFSSGFIWDEPEDLLCLLHGLRRLSLFGNIARARDLLCILQRTALLEEFELDELMGYGTLFRFLHHRTDEDIFLPNIVKISLYVEDTETIDVFSAHDLVRMLDSRRSSSSPLSSVTLYFTKLYPEDGIRELISRYPYLPIRLEAVDSAQTPREHRRRRLEYFDTA